MVNESEAKNDTDNRVLAQRARHGPAPPPPNAENATADSMPVFGPTPPTHKTEDATAESTPVYSQTASMDDEDYTSDEDKSQVTTPTAKSVTAAATRSTNTIKRGLHETSGGTPKKPENKRGKTRENDNANHHDSTIDDGGTQVYKIISTE
jgi:hypothetical protein